MTKNLLIYIIRLYTRKKALRMLFQINRQLRINKSLVTAFIGGGENNRSHASITKFYYGVFFRCKTIYERVDSRC